MIKKNYDIIIIGAGHAGCEAALASARLGNSTLLLSMNLDSIALMACNPSIGGTSKGHLVREIDALGGEIGKAIDNTCIQIKMLNLSKGPAVHSLRAQADKKQYHEYMKKVIEQEANIDLKQDEVVSLDVEEGRITGVVTAISGRYTCKAAVICSGVYLKSRIIIGDYNVEAGPSGLFGANKLSCDLIDKGIKLMRFKTGTPARVNKNSIDFDKMEIQYGNEGTTPFSFMTDKIERPHVPCYLTWTNERTHKIINDNLYRAPLYSGDIDGVGPRYCPSIESKVVRFMDKERHQVFIEPEGLNTDEMYIQGMSTSLPFDVQVEMYRTIPGLENCEIMRPAYAIEYDCIDSTQLTSALMVRHIDGLFMAGQINGSSGYEEAAAQGIMAGINASKYLKDEEPLVLSRSEAYIGVLIDDLVAKGTEEPYRMMTSRAEHRLLLRQDNADFRLTEIGYNLGLASHERYERMLEKKRHTEELIKKLQKMSVKAEMINELLGETGKSNASIKISEAIKRPRLELSDLLKGTELEDMYSKEIVDKVQIELKYSGYVDKQQKLVEKQHRMENKKLGDIDYSSIKGLRLEAIQKLNDIKPENIGQASRISGVSPADIAVLMIYLKRLEDE
jgi:tRNA uridine 5-carboxymethylaminomethyl modification enzyme